MEILTPRMRLVPATAALVRAEIAARDAFATLLDAEVPDDWPPEMLRDALPWFAQQLEAAPELSGWLAWYGLRRANPAGRATLVASGGFLGRPQAGLIEVGYSVLPAYQRRGLAREMLAGLLGWAFAHAEVTGVVADIHEHNAPSRRLALSLGFSSGGAGGDPGYERFELPASRWSGRAAGG